MMFSARSVFRIFTAGMLLPISQCSTSSLHADDAGLVVEKAVATAVRSTVRIRIIGSGGAGDLPVSSRVTTGVVISEDGDVLTSAFGFTSQPAAVFVEDSDGERISAKIVATDHVRKLVLLRCDGGTFVPPKFQDERWPQVGATAIAVGKLYTGAPASVSVGIVSAVNRIFGLAIQTDAKISPVNYGGPLLNLNGDVLGILVPLSPQDSGDDIEAGVEWYDSGIGFAIPMSDALKAAQKLGDGEDRVRGVIGVGFSTKNPLATEFDIKQVYENSPAAKAGLKIGDVLVSANGVPVDRFGVFEAIVKSSYAGDRMQLRIKRGEEVLLQEVLLSDKLARPIPGHIGIIIDELVSDAEEKAIGVRVYVAPGSPAANAGLPESAIISTWGSEAVDSVAVLTKAIRGSAAGQSVAVEWMPGPDDRDSQMATVEVVKRANEVVEFPGRKIAEILGTEDSIEWKRVEKSVGDDGGKVWSYAPVEANAADFGLVVLLSENGVPHETILKRWKDVCELHNLILVVPVGSENKAFTREDMAFLQRAVATALAAEKGRRIEASRTILVTAAPQAEICTELILKIRRRMFRAAVFVDCWPQVFGVSPAVLTATSPSALVLSGNIQSRQRQALQQQAVSTLRESGTWVVQHELSGDDETSAEEHIANWIFNLKVR